jgi:hypothetical protein
LLGDDGLSKGVGERGGQQQRFSEGASVHGDSRLHQNRTTTEEKFSMRLFSSDFLFEVRARDAGPDRMLVSLFNS